MQSINPRGLVVVAVAVIGVSGALAARWVHDSEQQTARQTTVQQVGRIYDSIAAQPLPATPLPPALVVIAPPQTPAPEERPDRDNRSDRDDREAAADPTEDLALQAITGANGVLTAWLVKLSDRQSVEARAGETAFGFEISEVRPDGVVLTQLGQEYDLGLDDRYIPPIVPTTVDARLRPTTRQARRNNANNNRRTNNNRNQRQSASGQGDRRNNAYSRNLRNQRNNERRAQQAARNAPEALRRAQQFSFNNSRSQQRALRSFQQQRGTIGGAAGITYNAQEARRTGARFVNEGGDAPVVTINPQTARRTGQLPTATGSGGGAAQFTGSQTGFAGR